MGILGTLATVECILVARAKEEIKKIMTLGDIEMAIKLAQDVVKDAKKRKKQILAMTELAKMNIEVDDS